MKPKTVNRIGRIVNAFGVGLFASSFFVKDNEVAVNRRWMALGFVAVGVGLHIYTGKISIKKS